MDLKKRLGSIVNKDKKTNPNYIIDVIKSDIYYMLNNYFEVDFDTISVNVELIEEKYKISLSALGERQKMMKVLPE